MSKLHVVVGLILILPLGILGAGFWLAPELYEEDLRTTFPHREADWTGSTTCQSCHPDQYASWHRTFHRTMTQEATPKTVVGEFDGQKLTFGFPNLQGELVTVRPRRDGDRFFMDYLAANGKPMNTLEIVRTVGSRRYQQYLVQAPQEERGNNYYRIPILWHIGEERWIHLNGAFLGHDDEHFDNHLAIWNQNCIFCHNTGPEPGMLNYDEVVIAEQRGVGNSQYDGKFDSEVAELGISCESCHAPSGEHAARNRNPLRRYLLHLGGADDPTIVNPEKLSQEKSVEVCGQCHGQRLPDPPRRIKNWLEEGPTYRAGEALLASLDPVSIDTPGPAGNPDLFTHRFWPDGTPRLTAYEYQGITSSPCYLEGELTCISCHSMHGGDVRGQIEPAMRTKAACADCHPEQTTNIKAHTFHEPDGSGSDCYACHMPKMIYGVLEIHRTHLIHNPDPAVDAEAARPNACTLCHIDKSAPWAAEKSREFWGGTTRIARPGATDPEEVQMVATYRLPAHRGDGAPVGLAETTAALLAGDPVQRAVAARLAGRGDTPLEIEKRAFLWPLLLQGLQDNYPTIRWFSQLSLRALDEEMPIPGFGEALERFDYIAPAPQREVVVTELLKRWSDFPKDHLPTPPEGSLVGPDYQLLREEAAPLLALQANKLIHVGE